MMAANNATREGEDGWSSGDSDASLSEASEAPSPPPPPARRRLGVPPLRLGGAAPAGVPALKLGALGRSGADAPPPPRTARRAPDPGALDEPLGAVSLRLPCDDGPREEWTVDVLARALSLSVPANLARRAGAGETARDPAGAAGPRPGRGGVEWAETGDEDQDDGAASEDDDVRGNGMFRALSSPQDENVTPTLPGAPRGFAARAGGAGVERPGRAPLKLPLQLPPRATRGGANEADADDDEGDERVEDAAATARGEDAAGARILTARAACDAEPGQQPPPSLRRGGEPGAAGGKPSGSPVRGARGGKAGRLPGLSLDLSGLRGDGDDGRGGAAASRGTVSGAPPGEASGRPLPWVPASAAAAAVGVPPEVAAETARRLGVDASRLTWHVLGPAPADAAEPGAGRDRAAGGPAARPRRAAVSISGSALSLSSLELLARDRLWLLAENARLERRLAEAEGELERAGAARGRLGAPAGTGLGARAAEVPSERFPTDAASLSRFPSPTKREPPEAGAGSSRLQRGSLVPRLALGAARAAGGGGGGGGGGKALGGIAGNADGAFVCSSSGSVPALPLSTRGRKRDGADSAREDRLGASRSPLKGAPAPPRSARGAGAPRAPAAAAPPLSARSSAPHIAFAVPPPGSARGRGGGRGSGGGGGSPPSPSSRAEVEALRRRLAESEAKRRSGRLALAEVRAEFARLLKELSREEERRAEQGLVAKEELIRAHQPGRDPAVGW